MTADSAGTYSYLCDGASPGSPVLSDGHALYTPGLSETRNGTSAFYSSDRLGNLWTADGSSKNQLTYEDFTGFGSVTAGGSGASPFGYGGGNGCQTEADTGLVLMGHRYFDPRTGRFISQDPAGSGDNWYAYADNNPVNEIDPSGLTPTVNIGGWSPSGSPGYSGTNAGAQGFDDYQQDSQSYLLTHYWLQDHKLANGQLQWVPVPGSDTYIITPILGIANTANPMSEMRMPKPLLKVLVGAVLGGLSGLLPGSHGAGQKAPETQSTPSPVENNNTNNNKKNVKKAILGVGGVAVGIGVWEGVK